VRARERAVLQRTEQETPKAAEQESLGPAVRWLTRCTPPREAMSCVEWIGESTAEFHDISDEEVPRLRDEVTADDYRRYLAQLYGFICPLEHALAITPGLDRYVRLKKFHKHELLRRDLAALRMSADEIARIPQCAIPWFKSPEEALGWAYPIERSTLRHGDLYRHLAARLPGEIAFASSYLKCYFGAVGEAWQELGRALDAFEHPAHRAHAVLDGARAGFRRLRGWRFLRTSLRPLDRVSQLAPRAHGSSARRRDLGRARP
jgi:heme oxygenase